MPSAIATTSNCAYDPSLPVDLHNSTTMTRRWLFAAGNNHGGRKHLSFSSKWKVRVHTQTPHTHSMKHTVFLSSADLVGPSSVLLENMGHTHNSMGNTDKASYERATVLFFSGALVV